MDAPTVIDVHVHFCRTAEQEAIVFPRPGLPLSWRWANGDAYRDYIERANVEAFVGLNYMVVPQMFEQQRARRPDPSDDDIWQMLTKRVRDFNTWTLERGAEDPRIRPFLCCDIGTWRTTDAMMQELERGVASGARGVKMHPGLGRYFPADERMFPLYARLEEVNLPILSDTGSLRGGPGDDVYGMPDHFIPVFERFPRLQFIMAHMPSAYWDQRLAIARRFPQVLFDTAGGFDESSYSARDGRRAVALEDAARIIRTIGVERVLFGSDAPGADQRPQVLQLLRSGLSSQELDQVLAANARLPPLGLS